MNPLRDQHSQRLRKQQFDVVIVGAGINGAASAAALSARGLKVALIDRADFAAECSSNSSNLIWGGIKYLESREFLLVNKLCQSRNRLMRAYPSRIKEIRFLAAIEKGFRFSPWFLYLGGLLYWLMGRCFMRPPQLLSVKSIQVKADVINTDRLQGGMAYSDAYIKSNDARFVFDFVQSAINNNTAVANYTESLGSTFQQDHWLTQVHDRVSNETFTIRSSVLVNACGPWVDQCNRLGQITTAHHHVFSKGIHLIVDRVIDHKTILAFFASDGRLFFAIPMANKTCIGTTDTRVDSPETQVTEEDRNFVLDNINRVLDLPQPLTQTDIIAERCGVRPLVLEGEQDVADWIQLSRKHVLEVDQQKQHISIFGGKLTDCLNIGEEIVDAVQRLGLIINAEDQPWYGEPPASRRQEFMQQAQTAGLDQLTPKEAREPLSQRFWRRYGETAFQLLDVVTKNPEKAQHALACAALTWAEIDWIADNEMVVELEDLLRRRAATALLIEKQVLINDPGLPAVCQRLFGQEADKKLEVFKKNYVI